MPTDDPRYNFNGPIDDEEYKRRSEAKARRRKKRQTQRLVLVGAFALAAILLIVCIVLFFRAIFGKNKAPASTSVPSVSVSIPEPEPVYAHPIAPDPTLWSLQLVNVQTPLPDNFTVADDQLGSIVQGGVAFWFDGRIVEGLNQMIADCNANVEGGSLAIVSGYRSPKTQNDRFARLIEVLVGQGQSAAEAEVMARQIEPPSGLSEHQLGLAVDFVTGTVNEPSQLFAETPEYQWLIQNAANYGFILRYPVEKEGITGILSQPYHFRYVGVEGAQAIVGAGISLEEYMLAVPEAASDPADASTPASVPAATPSSTGSLPTD